MIYSYILEEEIFMPKIVVTERLADTLKMLRMQNNIKSKELAEHLGKTPGYITKLEKQEIKSVELETVDSIFSYILGNDYRKTEIWEQIYASLQLKYSKAEIEEEVWFANFDTVYRQIPIPETLIEYINERIISLHITRDVLLKRINANEALTDDEVNDINIKPNIWYPSKSGKGSSIKINMSVNMLSNILDKKISSSPYVFIFCILYYIYKIEQYGEVGKLEVPQTKQLYRKVTLTLNSYKFYSIVERDAIVKSAQSKEEMQDLLSSFDNENAELISEILRELKLASELNIEVTNERLSAFIKNLNCDLWFTLKIISLNYNLLDNIDMDQRKEFVDEVESLIHKYTDSQKKRKNIETY